MKRIRTVIKTVLWFCLCLILAGNLYLLYAKLVLKQELPSVFGYSQVVVLSGSMEPEFSAGDFLLVRKQDSYHVGDVVTFSVNGSMVTHRIVDETEQGFQTQGDANNTPDEMILKQENIYGTLQMVVPGFGEFILFLKSPLGILCIVVVGFLLIEIPYALERRKKPVQGE